MVTGISETSPPKWRRLKKEWLDDWMPQLTSDEVPINQYRIIHDLQANVDAANTIITHDAGSPRDQLTPMWQCTAPRTYIGWGKSTQLGFGLGAIMGAKLAEPDKLCINIMGDAAIGMVGMDIETAVRNKIGILTIVFNNQIMAIERSHQPYSAESHDSLAHGGDYKTVAEGLGAWSEKVETPDDNFVPALETCHRSHGDRQARRARLRGEGGLRLLEVRVVSRAGRAPSKRPR